MRNPEKGITEEAGVDTGNCRTSHGYYYVNLRYMNGIYSKIIKARKNKFT
jgi:hypothetical protein